MKIKLVPLSIKNLSEFRSWVDKEIVDTDTVIGIRIKCKLTKIKEMSVVGPRWNTYAGIPLYFNF